MSESSQSSLFLKITLFVLVIVAVIVGAAIIPRFRNETVLNEVETDSANLARIAELKNVGIAHLENNDLAEAESAFAELVQLLPDEQFGQQNLAITLLLKIAPENLNRADDQARFDAEFSKASQAITELLERFPVDPQTHVIAARLELTAGDHGKAIERLRRAAELSPDNAAIWYGLFDAGRYSRNDELMAEADKALARVWELAPDNLYVMREWLTVQARAKDPGIGDTLAQTKKLVAPFVDRIRTFGRVDLDELLDQATAALQKDDWNTVIRNVSITGNMLRPEVATQNDAKKVTPHLLEFIVHDFSKEFYTHNTLPQPKFAEAIPVTFEPIETPFQKLQNAKQVYVVDNGIELLMLKHAFIVQNDQISIWSQTIDGEPTWCEWFSLKMSDNGLPSNLAGICLFDLDRDAAVVEHASDGQKLMCADADLDIVAYGKDGLVVLRNDLIKEGDHAGATTLTPVKQSEAFEAVKDVFTALPVDFDHDGDLDLVVSSEAGISLWLNRDDSTFAEHTQYSILPDRDAQIRKLIAVDWDRNVSIDILCLGSNDSGVLENLLHGQLRWKSLSSNTAFQKSIVDAAILDADSNFSWDVATVPASVGRIPDTRPALSTTANPDAGVVQFLKSEPLSSEGASGIVSADLDNDGFVDLITWYGRDLSLSRGGPQAAFQPFTNSTLTLPSDATQCSVADFDSDGDIDLIIACKDSVEVLINDGGNANNWIDIPIRAEDAKQAQKPNERVNIHGVGSLLELRSGLAYQPQVVTGRSTHFGLGKLKQVDSVRVLWTNGIPEHIVHPKHGEPICLQQHLKGSCPYLYTWDGEQFAFYTDCLWAAPIGLQLAEGVLAPPREWEYLKIDGDRLKAKDGEYVMQLTEELWEIGYFDSVRLLAIDHPADVDIYSNEKVGPPSISEFKVHTVRHPRTPVVAVDQRGRDILPKIATRDEDFVQCFDRRLKQGLTEAHFLELDLGQLDKPENITLFLTGWIRPTDTSLNVAISQRPDLESTQPPSVQVPNADGKWINVRPYMGFPGGKTKTIAIDLSDAFLTDDYRVRIATTMEIYWDHAFFTVDETPVEIRSTEMPLIAADLHYRGFSTKIPHPGLGPDSYDYQQLDTRLQWPPMEGRLTTYGDVTELVSQTDNRQALLGAGDEMELRFHATATELPSGWKRDFILHNVGWDKDADLNTVFGQSVDPLPFGGMTGYPDPNEPVKQKPFAAQTRQQPRAAFWRAFSKPAVSKPKNHP
ncbi:MAG: VCBS repeat-containing protein [Rhodopirellula sp.]|nr:VCBS repeat-containing protein [Rhodopirellula sp.]